jgi:hypothetical protein
MSEPRQTELGKIRRAAAVVELRMRLARALQVLPSALVVALAITAVTLSARKIAPDRLSNLRAIEILAGAFALALLALVAVMLRRLAPDAGTIALDRHHKLHDRLTNALAFEGIAPAARSALMEVAIDDACEHAGRLDPSKAAPLRAPSDLFAPFALGAGVAALALLYVPAVVFVPPQAKQIDALAMSPDDIELFRDAAKALERADQSPEMKAAVDKFNQLIEDIANKRLDRTEAFRKMEAIERDLLKGAEADAKEFEEALKDAAEELKKSELSRPVGESLEKKDLEKAQKDLKALAEQLKSGKKPDKAALDKLKQALAKASERKKEALAALNEKRNEIREDLLQKKTQKKDEPDAGPKNEQEERLLKKKERELERLDREAEQKERVGRQLERLDRELAKAAQDLMKDLGLSAQDLEQAAEDINRMQQEQLTEKDKEELRQRLEELREQIRQQGQAGKKRMARMMKFGKRARGSSGKGQKGDGEKGDGDKGDQEGEEEGKDGEGKDGEGKEGKDGKDGQGQKGGGKGQQWVIGPGGKKILIPGMGQGDMPGAGPGSGPGQDGPGAGQGGKEAGTGHDANLAGKRTDLKSGTTDVQQQGIDTQQGPSNSQVILSAAERGFKGTGYKKVFKDYHTVAEQQINKDQVPDGYRFYVHRYFQLIRPRE